MKVNLRWIGFCAAVACAPSGVGTQTPKREDRPPKCPPSSIWMDATEVSVAEYARCVSAGACAQSTSQILRVEDSDVPTRKDRFCTAAGADGTLPMNCVSLTSAMAYCKWVGKRLPTVDEWERAACGCDGRRFPWGDESPNAALVCTADVCPVGQHPADAHGGLHDAAGNVAEWTTTPHCFSNSCDGARVVVGGSSIQGDPNQWRCGVRSWAADHVRAPGIGFRCATVSVRPAPIEETHLK